MRILSAGVSVLVALAIIFLAALTDFRAWTVAEHRLDDDVFITIKPGESYTQVADGLVENGLVARRLFFDIYVRLSNKTESIQAGEYRFSNSVSPKKILHDLVTGDVVRYQTMLPEGGTFARFKGILQAAPKLTFDIENITVKNVLDSLDIVLNSQLGGSTYGEGWFFPDTYLYQANERASDILRQAHKRMVFELNQAWEQRTYDVPLNDPYELLILASILEKESSRDEDRQTISGVFSRRLVQGMRLQADPTVIYGLKDRFDGNLTRAHLRLATDYNTYIHRGLTPTPIAAPSTSSLLAAASPEEGNAMYFVARGDGSTHFSVTLKEHNAAVREYQR